MNIEKEIYEYWNPYISKLDIDDYYFYQDSHNEKSINLRSPFVHANYMTSKEELRDSGHIKCAIARMTSFQRGVLSDEIGSVTTSFSHVEKPYMSKYLFNRFFAPDLHIKFNDIQIWELINDVWTMSEFNCGTEESTNYWREIFSVRNRPESIVSDLPERMNIYRGGHIEGFSWTADFEMAQWFQNRNATFFGQCDLLKMEVCREDILFSGNREEEVVINPKSLDRKIYLNEIKILDTRYVDI